MQGQSNDDSSTLSKPRDDSNVVTELLMYGNRKPFKYFETVPFVPSSVVPNSVLLGKRWADQISTNYLPSTTFTYEVTFPNLSPLGLNLRPHYINSPGKGQLGCCVVVDAAASILNIIQPGDILLKINDNLLFNDDIITPFNFDYATQLITSASAPRTIKFLRQAGLNFNLLPSVAEISLYAKDTTVSAKFNCPDIQGGLQLTHLENLAPSSIKKMMNGNKVQWESLYPPMQSKSSQITQDTEGVFRDRNKWISVVKTPSGESWFVGRFDSEDEAIGALLRAQEDVRIFGNYSIKRIRRQYAAMVAANPRPMVPTIPNLPHPFATGTYNQNGSLVPVIKLK